MFVLKRFPGCFDRRAFVLIFGPAALLTAVGMGVTAFLTKHKMTMKRKDGGRF